MVVESWLFVLLCGGEALSRVYSTRLLGECQPRGQHATTHTGLAETHAQKDPC